MLRRSELLGLPWRDVDLDRRRLAVRQALVVVGGRPQIKDMPKSRHSYRTVELGTHAVASLRTLRVRQAEQRPLAGPAWDDHDLVFTREDSRW